MARKFHTKTVLMPLHDSDVVLVFPGGSKIVIQARPSNVDIGTNGSLDIILPDNQVVTNWEGDDMTPAVPQYRGKRPQQPHILVAKQLVTDLPGDYVVTVT